ncbi:DUF3526 domain-containing protein [Paraglaciecola aquimarina]|uniref:DUF3526 domain-containing protein n=1 Tax=Paraglaciecola aquimarina TaxID=1235557 RepID=A0ABU3SUZ3_9ALTE|nr:DUF3526 domain-containing protein [Paraglaciecola aquimarina]MDU0353808.1 DUF3526 domain-containing protein [Paraglaciecola aquimarina]
MKSQIIAIAKDEWRYWLRSKLALAVLTLGILLTISSVVVTTVKTMELNHQRSELQNEAEQSFTDQPDRHPHRMVHYGHYAFRTPTPLSQLDPGVDAFTGNSIFLEGHRQNSAMFADQRQGTALTKLGSLDPAFIIQILIPLLLILIGFSSVSRERESQTLTFILSQGVSIYTVITGKLVAMLAVIGLILVPVLLSALFTVVQGESLLTATSFIFGYFAYLVVWIIMIVLCSCIMSKNSESFSALMFAWILFCIIVPRVASTTAAIAVPSAGKLESDFAVIAQLRKLGDGHNANDPAFAKLKANLLAQYNVDSIEELPVNFRGTVAKKSEAELTKVLNEFAEQRMTEELAQSQVSRRFGWLSPVVAIRSLSMILAGTSIETHHRFLRETEALRFEFVQALNQVHIDKLNYQDDMNRNVDKEASNQARVSAQNWQVLQDFNFTADAADTRLQYSFWAFLQLFMWIAVLLVLAIFVGRRAQ